MSYIPTAFKTTFAAGCDSASLASILLLDDENVWIVADGMGGHHAGDFASQTIANNLSLFKQQASLDDSILLLEENIINSNAIIRNKTSQLGKNATIGSTLVK